jgi:nucleotide-binding universal stress UspA family protein
MFNRILVPLDGSPLAELVVPYVEELAMAFGAEIVVAHVREHRDDEYDRVHQLYTERMAGKLENDIKLVSPSSTVKPAFLQGEPASAIIDYARKSKVSLIIMATHGRSGIMAWAMGSVATKVIQKINVPVLLIRASVPAPPPGKRDLFRRILVPLDGSETGEAALPYVKTMMEKLRSEVTLLQVIFPSPRVYSITGMDYTPYNEPAVSSDENCRQYLEQASQRLAVTGSQVRTELRTGDPAQEIIRLADAADTSLIAISSHGRSGIAKWLLGSIANKVLNSASKPVLLVKARRSTSA